MDDVRDTEPKAGPPISGFKLYGTPEFKALCDILGIAWEKRTLGMVIILDPNPDALVTVVQSYRCEDRTELGSGKSPAAPVETTSLHNQIFRTFIPPVVRGK